MGIITSSDAVDQSAAAVLRSSSHLRTEFSKMLLELRWRASVKVCDANARAHDVDDDIGLRDRGKGGEFSDGPGLNEFR